EQSRRKTVTQSYGTTATRVAKSAGPPAKRRESNWRSFFFAPTVVGAQHMPFTFKLSQRLARMRCAVLLLATAVAACEKPGSVVAPLGPGARLVKVIVSPAAITLVPSQSNQFTAFGRTEAGESTSVAVTWHASG